MRVVVKYGSSRGGGEIDTTDLLMEELQSCLKAPTLVAEVVLIPADACL